MTCEHCGGSGVDPDSPGYVVSDCQTCRGSGEIAGINKEELVQYLKDNLSIHLKVVEPEGGKNAYIKVELQLEAEVFSEDTLEVLGTAW